MGVWLPPQCTGDNGDILGTAGTSQGQGKQRGQHLAWATPYPSSGLGAISCNPNPREPRSSGRPQSSAPGTALGGGVRSAHPPGTAPLNPGQGSSTRDSSGEAGGGGQIGSSNPGQRRSTRTRLIHLGQGCSTWDKAHPPGTAPLHPGQGCSTRDSSREVGGQIDSSTRHSTTPPGTRLIHPGQGCSTRHSTAPPGTALLYPGQCPPKPPSPGNRHPQGKLPSPRPAGILWKLSPCRPHKTPLLTPVRKTPVPVPALCGPIASGPHPPRLRSLPFPGKAPPVPGSLPACQPRIPATCPCVPSPGPGTLCALPRCSPLAPSQLAAPSCGGGGLRFPQPPPRGHPEGKRGSEALGELCGVQRDGGRHPQRVLGVGDEWEPRFGAAKRLSPGTSHACPLSAEPRAGRTGVPLSPPLPPATGTAQRRGPAARRRRRRFRRGARSRSPGKVSRRSGARCGAGGHLPCGGEEPCPALTPRPAPHPSRRLGRDGPGAALGSPGLAGGEPVLAAPLYPSITETNPL